MAEQRRASRADRRRANAPYQGTNRRKAVSPNFTAYSQTSGNELQIFAQTILTADNVTNARDVLMRHCVRAQSPVVVLDVFKVTYIDTIGLSLLFEIKRQIEAQARTFHLQNPSRAVLRMLNLTQMIRVFSCRVTNQDLERIPHAGKSQPPTQQQGR